MAAATGPAVFEAIRADLLDLKRLLTLPRSSQVIVVAMDAARWLNEHVEQRLGERNVVDVLSRSVPGNVTSEMGLALMDVADVVRPHPEVVAVLETAGDDVLDRLDGVEGGDARTAALRGYLDVYGMRCVGEIDVTRPRWVEQPSAVLPALLADVRAFAPGRGAAPVRAGPAGGRGEGARGARPPAGAPRTARTRRRGRRSRSPSSAPSPASASTRSTGSSAASSRTSGRCCARPTPWWRPGCSNAGRTAST